MSEVFNEEASNVMQHSEPQQVSDDGVSSTSTQPPSAPESVRSGIARPSGLKQPSRIGRICSHATPKPAIPTTPRSDDSAISDCPRSSDEYSRKHLSDLIEADEESETDGFTPMDLWATTNYYRTSYTSYSGNSMEALWDSHPRRLSEAGLRRSSDHSVVLTEDTDSFIIGDRVWVGGGKPGQIAYIGETQFAPGEWAGIVLDEPIGKNDGSVAGVRYFQCSDKRGVFSRLTRLTRTPIFQHSASPTSETGSSIFGSRPPTSNGTRRSPAPVPSKTRRALSPNGSIRSGVSSRMNQSIASSHMTGEVKVGERVIVSSSQGSKAGTLRFIGNTDFASGVWCGVELDDPIGKNDGSVEGKRYFECPPRFGLFAPLAKVSRSPSSYRPGHCAVHSTPLRRSNSRDSLTSFGTSIASTRPASRIGAQRLTSTPRNASSTLTAKNALQELLREKQQHLERLMKERELERAEVAKYTLQAERAEASLTQVKNENNLKLKENHTLKAELEFMKKQLEDERQKIEDLMFRSEEDNIHKEEVNKLKEALEAEKQICLQKISELEATVSLLEETKKASRAALARADDAHNSELEALRAQHNEEVHAGQELQKLLDEAYALLREKEAEKDSIGKSLNEELNRLRTELEKAQNDMKVKQAVAQTEFEGQITVLTAKLLAAETKLDLEKKNAENIAKEASANVLELTNKLSQVQAALDDKTHELNKVSGSSKEQELLLSKEFNKLKIELSAKTHDLEEALDSNNKHRNVNDQLLMELKSIKNEYESKMSEYDSLLNESSKINDELSEKLNDAKSDLARKTAELEKHMKEVSTSSSENEKIVADFKVIIVKKDKEIEHLKNTCSALEGEYNKHSTELNNLHEKQLQEKNEIIKDLKEILTVKSEEYEKTKKEIEEAISNINQANVDNQKLVEENKSLKEELARAVAANTILSEKVASLETELNHLNRTLQNSYEKCSELETAKTKLEQDINMIASQSSDSNEQFMRLTNTLRETEKELEELRDKFRSSKDAHDEQECELKRQYKQLEQNSIKENEKASSLVIELKQMLSSTEEKLGIESSRLEVIQNDLREKEEAIKVYETERSKITSEMKENNDRENKLISDIEHLKKQYDTEIAALNLQLDAFKHEGESSELKLQEKVNQLVETQNDLNNKLEQSRLSEEALQMQYTETTSCLENEKKKIELELEKSAQSNAELKNLVQSQEKSLVGMSQILEERENEIKQLKVKFDVLQLENESNVCLLSEKERQIVLSEEEITKAKEGKKQLENEITKLNLENSTLQNQLKDIILQKTTTDQESKDKMDSITSLNTKLGLFTKENEILQKNKEDIIHELNSLKSTNDTLANEKVTILESVKEFERQLHENEIALKVERELKEKGIVTEKELSNKIQKLENELQNENEMKAKYVEELTALKASLNSEKDEMCSDLNELKTEIETLKKTHLTEIESYCKKIKTLEETAKDGEAKTEQINEYQETIAELKNNLLKADEDIKKLTDINDGQKLNYEELNQKIQDEYEHLKKESKKDRHVLKDRIRNSESALKEVNTKLEEHLAKESELRDQLCKSQNRVNDLESQIQIKSMTEKDVNEKDLLLEKLNSDSYKEKLDKLLEDLDKKTKELRDTESIITNLQSDQMKQIAKAEIAEREKILMKKEMSTMEKDVPRGNVNTIASSGDNKKESDDREILDGQVSFLNSVIVDMQRKNEQLLARVQALESGFSPDELEEFQFNNGLAKGKKAVAPRVYCDICELFDAHETEDCPRQKADSPPPPSATKEKKEKSVPRPYCDICEVFGHATEDCNEDETF